MLLWKEKKWKVIYSECFLMSCDNNKKEKEMTSGCCIILSQYYQIKHENQCNANVKNHYVYINILL
jgi:hypothetical protein